MTTEPCSLPRTCPALHTAHCPLSLNPGCFRGVADFDLDCSRNGADRQATPRTEYLYATPMYRLTLLSYRSFPGERSRTRLADYAHNQPRA